MTYPNFQDANFLRRHIAGILNFYEQKAFDPQGGFFHCFLDDGSVYDCHTRHLVSSTRFVFNFAQAHLQTGDTRYRDWASHGFAYLISHHRSAQGHYVWQLESGGAKDGRALAYGHAFVMLAAAFALRLNLKNAHQALYDVYDFMEDKFFDPKHNAYADERDESLDVLSDYRGQNANMHGVEALIAAYEATQDIQFLNRAKAIAHQFCVTLAADSDGQVWEHYDKNWRHDWAYNIDKPDDLFKPWGYQPGHQVEWSKLLLQLDSLSPEDWYLPTAKRLFDTAMKKGWDADYGGLVYGYAPDGSFADTHKYFWVHAEAFAAAWRLYDRLGDVEYQAAYTRIWRWAWDHLIDHTHGGWYRIVSRQGAWVEPYKSPPGKVDYHTMGACWDVLAVQGQSL